LLAFLPGSALYGQSPQKNSSQASLSPGDIETESIPPSKNFRGALPEAPKAQPEQTAIPPLTKDRKPLVLSLAEAIAMAKRNNPRLEEAAAATQHAIGAGRVAHAYSNPSLEVYAGRQYARPVSIPGIPGGLQHYAAYQPIEIPAERHARQNAASFVIASSRAAQDSVGLSVIADTKHAFYNALRRHEEIDHARENLNLVQDLQHRVAVQVNVGEEGQLELTRASAELGRAQFAVTGAQLEYANAIALLRVTTGGDVDAELDPQGQVEERIPLPPVQQLRAQVLSNHPALVQSRADIDTSIANLDRERALRIPQPTLFAEFEDQPDLRFWRAGFTVPIPLWDRRKGQISEAKANTSLAASILYQRTLELDSALERAYEQYQLADQQATSLQSGSLRAAESAVEAAKAAYRFGERGIVEVLDAQRVLQGVRGDLVDAQFARQSALVDLEELGALAPGAKP
jgi:outer membrane protein, heavy metal efflux system